MNDIYDMIVKIDDKQCIYCSEDIDMYYKKNNDRTYLDIKNIEKVVVANNKIEYIQADKEYCRNGLMEYKFGFDGKIYFGATHKAFNDEYYVHNYLDAQEFVDNVCISCFNGILFEDNEYIVNIIDNAKTELCCKVFRDKGLIPKNVLVNTISIIKQRGKVIAIAEDLKLIQDIHSNLSCEFTKCNSYYGMNEILEDDTSDLEIEIHYDNGTIIFDELSVLLYSYDSIIVNNVKSIKKSIKTVLQKKYEDIDKDDIFEILDNKHTIEIMANEKIDNMFNDIFDL